MDVDMSVFASSSKWKSKATLKPMRRDWSLSSLSGHWLEKQKSLISVISHSYILRGPGFKSQSRQCYLLSLNFETLRLNEQHGLVNCYQFKSGIVLSRGKLFFKLLLQLHADGARGWWNMSTALEQFVVDIGHVKVNLKSATA